MSIWVYSNVDYVELVVNGVSQGGKNMTRYAHLAWNNVPFVPGRVEAYGFVVGSAEPVVYGVRNTTGVPSAIRLSIKDGVGADLTAGCRDVALIQAEIVDSNGWVVPYADNVVTFTVSGAGTLAGTANGDPACQVNNLSPWRPAFHGLMEGVVLTGDQSGLVKVAASSPGLQTQTILLTVNAQPQPFHSYWCKNGPRL